MYFTATPLVSDNRDVGALRVTSTSSPAAGLHAHGSVGHLVQGPALAGSVPVGPDLHDFLAGAAVPDFQRSAGVHPQDAVTTVIGGFDPPELAFGAIGLIGDQLGRLRPGTSFGLQ